MQDEIWIVSTTYCTVHVIIMCKLKDVLQDDYMRVGAKEK